MRHSILSCEDIRAKMNSADEASLLFQDDYNTALFKLRAAVNCALVEPFLQDIVASEKASAEKMILPPQMVVPWTTALKEVIVYLALFWSSLEGWESNPVLPIHAVGAEVPEEVRRALQSAPRREHSRVTFGLLLKAMSKVSAVRQMKQGQANAYEKWLGEGAECSFPRCAMVQRRI